MGSQPPLHQKGAEPPPQFSAHFSCGQTARYTKMPLGGRPHARGLCVRCEPSTPPLPKKGAEFPNYRPVYCGQTAAWIKMPLDTEVGRGSGDIVLDGDPAPPPEKGGRAPSPIFGPCLLWPNGWMDQYGTWHGGRPQPKRVCVRWGPNTLPRKGAKPPPQFSAHVYCGQTAAWINMPLGTKVGRSPGDIVLDGYPAPLPKKGAEPLSPNFVPCLLWPTAGWIKMTLGMAVGLGPGQIVLDGDPAPLPPKWGNCPGNCPPVIGPFFVAKQLDASRCHLVWRWVSAQATLC